MKKCGVCLFKKLGDIDRMPNGGPTQITLLEVLGAEV